MPKWMTDPAWIRVENTARQVELHFRQLHKDLLATGSGIEVTRRLYEKAFHDFFFYCGIGLPAVKPVCVEYGHDPLSSRLKLPNNGWYSVVSCGPITEEEMAHLLYYFYTYDAVAVVLRRRNITYADLQSYPEYKNLKIAEEG